MAENRDDSGRTAPARFAELVAASAAIHTELAELVGEGALEEMPTEELAPLAETLLASLDRGQAVVAGLTGRVDSTSGGATGVLVAGRYASVSRWLEAGAGMSRKAASSHVALARELRDHAPEVAEAWRQGRISVDSAREITVGLSGAMRRMSVPAAQRDQVRREALAILIPVAERGGHGDVRRAVDRLRFVLDPDGATQAAMDAYDDQSLTVTQVGSMTLLKAWLTHEAAAAAMTVIGQRSRRIADEERAVVHDPDCGGALGDDVCTCGAREAAGAVSKDRWPHLQAVAFAEIMGDLLDNGDAGSHHRVAPHVTLVVDEDDALSHLAEQHGHRPGLFGELALPGSDEPMAVPEPTVRRILCDSDVTTVITTRLPQPPDRSRSVAELLRDDAREVLWVGRNDRLVPPRVRRALEVRDRHCAFPGCRAHVGRCHAHHVRHWRDGGGTDPDNLVLLCVRHHVAVHEGGWSIRRTPGVPALATGAWTFDPPPRPGAPR